MIKRAVALGVAAVAVTLAGGASAQTAKAGQQEAQTLNRAITKVVKLNYLLYLPKDYGREAGRKWPLVLFLHGAGETGSDVEMVKKHGPPKLIAAGKEFPFIVASPQAPVRGWKADELAALLDEIEEKYAVDKDRVIVTGLSMGGYGTFDLAMAHPDRFAAIAPIAGGGQPRRSRGIAHIPVWVFHGTKDSVVPASESENMVNALKAAGADVKYTVYPELDHDSWTVTYENPALYEWMLAQKRKPRPVPR
jgi:predicted peptidase